MSFATESPPLHIWTWWKLLNSPLNLSRLIADCCVLSTNLATECDPKQRIQRERPGTWRPPPLKEVTFDPSAGEAGSDAGNSRSALLSPASRAARRRLQGGDRQVEREEFRGWIPLHLHTSLYCLYAVNIYVCVCVHVLSHVLKRMKGRGITLCPVCEIEKYLKRVSWRLSVRSDELFTRLSDFQPAVTDVCIVHSSSLERTPCSL